MPTMKNSSSLGISKQKPMKRRKTNKKQSRRTLKLNKVASYLISDPYLYTPLFSPQPTTFDHHFPSPNNNKHIFFTDDDSPGDQQEDVALPIKKTKGRNLMEKVMEFLEADCFLYSPLVNKTHDAVDTTSVSGHSQTMEVNVRTETQGNGSMEAGKSNTTYDPRKQRCEQIVTLGARPVVMKTVSYRESVKHMLQPDYRTKSNQGA